MSLKKPSEYFRRESASVDNSIQDLGDVPELSSFSDAFDSFKNNLSRIEVFSNSLDNYNSNIEKVNELSQTVGEVKEEIQNLINKKDLDRAMMTQLLVVEQSIREVQSKVKSINEDKLSQVRSEVVLITNSVNDFVESEVPRYKKLLEDTNRKYERLEGNVNKSIEESKSSYDKKYQKLTETLQGINEKSLSGFLEDFKLLDENFAKLKKEDIPKYKGFIVETERKTESKLEDFDAKTDSKLDEFNQKLLSFEENVKDRIDNVQSSLKEFVEVEAPKYNKLLIENKLKTEEEVKVIQKNIEEKVSQFVSDIETLKSNALNESKEIDKFVTEKIGDFKKVLTETQKDVKKTLSTYTSISKTFEDKVLTENEKLNSYDETLKDFSGKINECLSQVLLFKEEIEINEEIQNEWKEVLKGELSQRIKEYKEELNEEVVLIQNDLSKKVSDLEINIVRNESHLKVQNKNLEQIQEDVRSTIQKLNIEELEEQNYELGKKVKYLEEVFEKFNEKEILTESIIAEPPSVDNKDPLTPLDQNFVTLDQLQQHYRLFINRIQQQLASIGGGGETRLKYLDDIVGIATNPSVYDGKLLKYDHSIGKFEFGDVDEQGISISEENIIYVAKDGNDGNSGTLTQPKLTIKAAVESIVSAGTTDKVVRVAPGTYIENNPIILPDEVTVIGHSLRETTVIPQNDNQDLFYVGNGNYIAEMSFRGSLPGKAVVSFDPTKPRYITQSPYVQNCTNFIPDSIGLRVDGSAAMGPIKSMVLDSYTQYNQGGIGASITNQGYAQLVSMFTICDEIAIYCGSGGGCDLTNSNSSFGDYGLVADGVSGKLFSGIVTTAASELSDSFELLLEGPELSVSNALYDKATGLTTITTSSNHNLNVGAAVTISDLKFTCDSFTDIEEYTVSNAVYDNTTGILTVTTAEQNELSVGISVTMSNLKFSCDSFVGITTFDVSNAVYDNTTGILTVTTSGDHNFTTNLSVDFNNLVFECDSGGGLSTAYFPPYSGDGNGDPDATTFEVLSTPSSTTFTVNVGPSTIVHTYQEGGTVAIGTITTFPSGRFGNVFEITKINSNTEFVTNVGVSTFIHSYVSGGNVSISTIANFPNGNQGYVFNVQKINSSTEFETYVGVSTFIHTYDSGGNVKLNLVRPYDGQTVYFNELYENVKTISITNGGSGYTSTPIVTIDPPSESWGVRAKAIATIENGSVTQIDILSNGRGYTTTPNITFSAPQSGINTAEGSAILTPEYYTVNKSTEISNGITTVTLNENIPFAVGVGTTVNFFRQSRILATGHSFEFIGSGTDISNAVPFSNGSPPIPENETDARNGGLVVYTSTSQSGNFKIGDGVTINQNTSSITGQAYEKSLVSTMTPYILSLGAL